MKNRYTLVCDVDDVLWDLNKRAMNAAGTDIFQCTAFDIRKNFNFSKEEQDTILAAYQNPKTFENITWDPAILRLPLLQNTDIYINSHCGCQEIADLKKQQLQPYLQLPDDHYIFSIVSHGIEPKEITEDVDFFIDDSPYNIANSKAKYNFLISKPWNVSSNGQKILGDAPYLLCPTLEQALVYIDMLI